MTHPSEDSLLLLAYGELPDADAAKTEVHLAQCPTCHARFEGLARARVALDAAAPRRRAAPWIAAGLAAAAVVALVLLARPEAPVDGKRGWRPATVWSATAGYIAGGPSVVQIDAQLTRLEKERSNGFPN